ncbi:hypothetical protein [Fodinicola acaciae]|uniref:hypothetical protein n=1 Tax=Fodinicola acaciae TaxID=2681555 RepID=UPI0013D19108|nr:hypothetical protein [Fodinicola acaciae]
MPRPAAKKPADRPQATELREISEFAQQQAVLLKSLFGFTTDTEFAQLSLLKLQEEAGEVAEAYLAYRKLQRADKLKYTDAELKANLGKELADVTVVIALLAHAVGLEFHDILSSRLDDLYARRPGMKKTISDRLMASWEKSSPVGDQLELPLPEPY